MKKFVSILIIPMALLIIGGCEATTTSDNGQAMQTQSAQSGSAVTISNFDFSPGILTVAANTMVTWTNNDSVEHNVTEDADSSAPGFESQNLAQGQSYSYTFTKPGTYNYHCSIHPSMKGTVVVTQ